jgi:ABC-2 type transport system permease protein
MNLHRVLAVVSKEAREIVRDSITVGVSILLPLVMLFLFGYAISLDVDDVALGVLDHDKSPASRELTDGFVQSGYFSLIRDFRTVGQVEDALQRGQIKMALVIPPRFHADLVRKTQPVVQVLVDGTYSVTAMVAANYAQTIVSGFRLPKRPDVVKLEIRVWYNAPMRSINYVVPGLYAVILMAFPPLLTALALVREKESGSIQQIFASPLTPAEFIIGKLIPYGLIAFAQMLMVISVGFFWFEVPFQGNLGLLMGTSFIFVFCTVGIGLLVSTITRSQLTAMLLALIITLMPSFLFSGFLFPIFTMPYVLQLYTTIFPTRYFVELSRGIVLKGGGLDDLWLNVVILLVYTFSVFILAAWRFRKKVA